MDYRIWLLLAWQLIEKVPQFEGQETDFAIPGAAVVPALFHPLVERAARGDVQLAVLVFHRLVGIAAPGDLVEVFGAAQVEAGSLAVAEAAAQRQGAGDGGRGEMGHLARQVIAEP